MTDGLFQAGLIVSVFAALGIILSRKWRRQESCLLSKRLNLSKPEFIAALAGDADSDVAKWLRDELHVYFHPRLAPHPDDHLIDDLPIDPDEPAFWLQRFCTAHSLSAKDFSTWPDEHPLTVRHFAAWLTMEKRRLEASR